MMEAYVYCIYDTLHDKYYYGVRKAKTFDLFTKYFTSSKVIRQLIALHGTDIFQLKLRKKFDSYEEARAYETKFLTKVRAATNLRFYNQAVSSPRLCSMNPEAEARRRKNISATVSQKWKDPEYKANHPFINVAADEKHARAKLGAETRAEKYKTGELTKKNNPKVYSYVSIIRDGVVKQIRRNQVPAYRKYGWEVW